MIPYDQGKEPFRAAPDPKTFLEILGGHNDGFMISADYISGIETWLEFIQQQ